MYRSPIDMLISDIQHQIEEQYDEQIYKAVASVGIHVDKEELLKALQYDRHQYMKGHFDGVEEATPKWISVEERLPTEEDANEEGLVLVRNIGCPQYEAMDWDQVKMFRSMISNWMHMPEPPKEDDHGKTLE